MSKVVSMAGMHAPKPLEPVPEIIALIERLAAHAASGNLRGLAVVTVDASHGAATEYELDGLCYESAVAGAAILQHRLLAGDSYD